MVEAFSNSGKGIGKLEEGIIPKETTIKAVVDFIIKALPLWANDPKRPQECSENKLNPLLCDFLDVKARECFPLIRFQHEEPQGGKRQVDLAVKSSVTGGINVAGNEYSIYKPFFVIEGKRLPAPTKDREREYVTGGKEVTGGIQRFKTGDHGSSLNSAALIGYVQQNNFEYWFDTVNGWIGELSRDSKKENISWETDEILRKISFKEKSAMMISSNKRNTKKCETPIKLYHLWVDLKNN